LDIDKPAIAWMQGAQTLIDGRTRGLFFVYFATRRALHAPHMFPKEYIDSIKGKFVRDGIGVTRRRTFARQKKNQWAPSLATAEITKRPGNFPFLGFSDAPTKEKIGKPANVLRLRRFFAEQQ